MSLTEPSPPAASTTAAPRWPALDGLRGLAVAAVVAYHLGHLEGGYLGVDLFFVLSGFLITSLMLRERAATGRISLRDFWLRRARRLLPALGLALVAVVVGARIFLDHDRLPALRGDALAAAAYVANWRFALAGEAGYFAADPSPLRHTWSLAIEEQFYLVWPLAVVAAALLARRLGTRTGTVVAIVAGAGAVASTGWMALHAADWSTDRLYLGTDTRLAAPLLGALLACVLQRRRRPEGRGSAGAAGVLVAAVAALGVSVVTVDASSDWMYRGGFALMAALAAAAVGAGALTQVPAVETVLGTGPLRWLGERSYGLYLYSWPIQVFAAAQGLEGWALSATTVALSLIVAAASHRWIEMPIRHGRPRTPADGAEPVVAAPARPVPALWRRPGARVGLSTALVLAVVVAGTITDAEPDPLVGRSQEEFEAEATRPAVTGGPTGGDIRVLVVGDSVGYTLGQSVPDGLVGVASVDSRALPGCGLMTSGARPPDAVAAGSPATYDGCAEPVAEADRLGLEGRPDVVLLVTGAWETAVHERDGREVGPGDEEWAAELRDLLAFRVAQLSATGAVVALWVDPCAPTETEREAQAWYTEEVLVPTANDADRVELVRPATVACEDGTAKTDIPDVGDPRPDDGQHWSAEGAAWLWRTWAAPTLRILHIEGLSTRGVPTMVAGDSVGFTLEFYGKKGAAAAGYRLVPGPATIGCGLVREGTAYDGVRDLAETCGPITEAERIDLTTSEPELVLAAWGAWEMAGVTGRDDVGSGLPGDPAYDAHVRQLLTDRLTFLGSTGAQVVVLGVDCWPPVSEYRSAERVRWWQDLSREVADEVGATYLDPTPFLCRDGQQRHDVPGVGNPRPQDGAHWITGGADWFWTEWLGPQLDDLRAAG